MALNTFLHKGRQVCDDRLRLVPLVTAGELDPGAPGRLRRALNRATIRTWRWWGVFVCTGIASFYVTDLALGSSKPIGEFAFRSVGYAIGAMLGALVVTAVRSSYERSAMRQLRSLDRCASCGYSLRGPILERDGCVVCPECRAAWRPDNPPADFR